MFDIGWSEILVIAVVAIVVVGPKDLPPMLRAAGRMVSKLRRTAGEFQSQFNEALREAELDGVKESIDQIRGLNPMNEIRKTLDPIQHALESPTPIAKPAPEPVPPPMDQTPQPATAEDLEPASAPVEAEPAVHVPAPEVAGAVAAAEPAPAKKRTRKPKTAAAEVSAVDAAEPVPPVKKPRAPRRKPAAKPETVNGVEAELGAVAADAATPEIVVPVPEPAAAPPVSEEATPAETAATPEGRSA